MSDADTEFSRAIAERYRIERELGRGGMATVYLADDVKHGRRVAIKVMDPRIGAAIGPHRFLREIEIAARLTHPHILPLFDSGEAGGLLYYVMPFIAGESLRARLDREGRLPIEEAVRLARDIAGALAHAHARGLVHRDIKPENVLLADGIAQVADFGIARTRAADATAESGPNADPDASAVFRVPAADASAESNATIATDATIAADATIAVDETIATDATIPAEATIATSDETQVTPRPATPTSSPLSTMAGTIIGTPRYMAPEQAQGSLALDARADQYALGCVLHELLTGRPPFESRVLLDLIRQHADEDAPAPSSSRPEVPEALDRVVSQAMAKSPDDRFADMQAFASALAEAMGATPEARPETRVPNNLPKDRTRFVGRTRELSACLRLLAQTRLLTLTGIGGGGKTRLSLEVARRAIERFPDGVWFVDLASLDDPERVAQTIALTVGIAGEPDSSPLALLEAHFAERRSLLLLNNCEHLRAAVCDVAARLLPQAAGLTILATSRASLGTAGEQLFPLGSLTLPAAGASSPERIGTSEAVRLLVDRARMGDPGFELNAETAPPVAEICRRLDGIPLALELAAARLRVLTSTELLQRLDDRFRLLTGGSKAALPRHQTLRAAIAWSYDQLDDDEKQLLRFLGIFRGGCTLEGATRVAGAGIAAASADAASEADEFQVLDRLGRLVDNSLLVMKRVDDGSSRYEMLETVREFAYEQLVAAGEFEAVASAHLVHFRTLAAESVPKVHLPEAGATRRAIDREVENIVAALSRSGGLSNGALLSLDVVAALRMYWVNSGRVGLGARLVAEALERAASLGPIWQRATALQTAATLAFYQSRFADAQAAMEEALGISRALEKWLGVAAGLSMLGTLAERDGDTAKARVYLSEALDLFRTHGDEMRAASMLNSLANLHMTEDDADGAIALYTESVVLSLKVGNQDGASTARLNLVRLALLQDDLPRALESLGPGFALAVEVVSTRHLAAAFDLAAVIADRRGDARTAARFMGVALRIREEASQWDELQTFEPLVEARAHGRETLGATLHAECIAAGRALEDAEAQRELSAWIRAAAGGE